LSAIVAFLRRVGHGTPAELPARCKAVRRLGLPGLAQSLPETAERLARIAKSHEIRRPLGHDSIALPNAFNFTSEGWQ
jgi:hypothetical protein